MSEIIKEINDAIEVKKEQYRKNELHLSDNDKRDLLKNSMAEEGTLTDVVFSFIFIFILFICFNVNFFKVPETNNEFYSLLTLLSLFESILFGVPLLIGFGILIEKIYKKTGVLLSIGYLVNKLSSKRNKEKIFENFRNSSFMNTHIEFEFFKEISPHIKKHHLEEFLTENKNSPTYNKFVIFCINNGYLEENKIKIENKKLVNKILDDIYTEPNN